MSNAIRAYALAAALFASPFLNGCIPVIVAAGVGGAALVATDRRSVGAQADDEAIELKIANTVSARYGESVHVNATSYNGVVLLTGEVPDQASKDKAEQIAKSVDLVVQQSRLSDGSRRITAIAEVLGIDVGTFFTGKEMLENEQSKQDGAPSPLKLLTVSGAFRLLRAYGDIEDSNLRRAIVDLVEQISTQKRVTA